MTAGDQDALLEALGIASVLRATGVMCCDEIVSCYVNLWARSPQLEAVAQAHVGPALAQVLQESEAVAARIQSDPAAPGLEEAFRSALDELSALAAVFAGSSDREADNSDDYRSLCRMISRLQRVAEPVAPLWALMRHTMLAGRGRPPRRAASSAPMADDAEYYA